MSIYTYTLCYMLLLARPYRSSGNVQLLILSIVALINVMQYLSVTIFLSSNTYECFPTLINVYLNSVKKMKKVEYMPCQSKTALLQGHEENYKVSYGNSTCESQHIFSRLRKLPTDLLTACITVEKYRPMQWSHSYKLTNTKGWDGEIRCRETWPNVDPRMKMRKTDDFQLCKRNRVDRHLRRPRVWTIVQKLIPDRGQVVLSMQADGEQMTGTSRPSRTIFPHQITK